MRRFSRRVTARAPSFAELRARPFLGALPLDPREPLAVHKLGGVSRFADFAAVWDANALLAPAASRRVSKKARRGWPAPRQQGATRHAHMIMERDLAAGDGDYLFFTINAAYQGGGHYAPAVAYRLATLCARAPGNVGFRPHDLEPAYSVVDDELSDAGGCNCDAARDEDCTCTMYDAASEELSSLAYTGTIFGCPAVMRLAEAHIRALHGERTIRDVRAIIEPKLREVAEAKENLRAVDDLDWSFLMLSRGGAEIDWLEPFSPGSTRPGRPEIVYRGALRLHEAAYVLVDSQTWVAL